jgi:hypothetical protein
LHRPRIVSAGFGLPRRHEPAHRLVLGQPHGLGMGGARLGAAASSPA